MISISPPKPRYVGVINDYVQKGGSCLAIGNSCLLFTPGDCVQGSLCNTYLFSMLLNFYNLNILIVNYHLHKILSVMSTVHVLKFSKMTPFITSIGFHFIVHCRKLDFNIFSRNCGSILKWYV